MPWVTVAVSEPALEMAADTSALMRRPPTEEDSCSQSTGGHGHTHRILRNTQSQMELLHCKIEALEYEISDIQRDRNSWRVRCEEERVRAMTADHEVARLQTVMEKAVVELSRFKEDIKRYRAQVDAAEAAAAASSGNVSEELLALRVSKREMQRDLYAKEIALKAAQHAANSVRPPLSFFVKDTAANFLDCIGFPALRIVADGKARDEYKLAVEKRLQQLEREVHPNRSDNIMQGALATKKFQHVRMIREALIGRSGEGGKWDEYFRYYVGSPAHGGSENTPGDVEANIRLGQPHPHETKNEWINRY
jgi:chromosome segregation ATPase